MPRTYSVSFDNATIAAASGDYDLFELDAATDKPVAIKAIILDALSEVAEAQEEWLRISVIRGHTTSGNGTATTARPDSPNDTAAAFAAETIGATIASAGTAVTLLSRGFQVRAGFEMWLPPEDWIWTSGADLLVVRLVAAVADDLTMSGTIKVVEVP